MTWHVRYFSPALKQDLMSPEMATKDEAMKSAWSLATEGEDVTAIEGPDGEIVSFEEIEVWAAEQPVPST